jgi:hypothetical protein
MAVVDLLMDTAAADTELLANLAASGDRFSVPRDVDFLLRAPTREKAETVADFINECGYGIAARTGADGSPSVQVIVRMPVDDNVIRSVSALMACISALFDLDYDGWGCNVQS